jgi:hypothetical protein
MITSRLLGWLLLVAWLSWGFALQARLAAASAAGPFVPEIGLVLSLAVLARLDEREAPVLALVVACARLPYSGEPVVALLAGTLGLALLGLAVRSVVELTGPLWRTITTGALVLVFDLWLAIVHGTRPEGTAAGIPVGFGSLIAVAFSSSLLMLFAGPTLAHLPGLTPLRRRRW